MRTRDLLWAMLVVAAPLHAAPSPDEVAARAVIDRFIAAFNTGDAATAKAAHVANPVIIDEPPPFLWDGKDSFDRWVADQHKEALADARTDEKVVLGRTRRAEIADGNAYVIVPATYSYTVKGVAMAEPSQMTFVLKNARSGWKIAAWAWTGPRGRPASKAETKPAP